MFMLSGGKGRVECLGITRPNPTLGPCRPTCTMSIPAPFLLHLVRPALGTSPPHEGLRTLHEASATPPLPPPTPRFSVRRGCSYHTVLRVLLVLRRYTV